MPNPTFLGKYEIAATLGKGGMGIVYKGFDPVIQRTVAVKTLRRNLLEGEHGPSALQRFKNEARAAGRLSHPGIVSIYDYGEDDNVAYIAMEYVEGRSLREYFSEDTRFPVIDVVSIMLQMLDALGFAHEQGIVHRDIKPSNIMLTSDGKLKICDFGIARVDTSTLTQIGSVLGTPNYMAPERLIGLPTDRRADVYSAGVVFYELLTGSKPFPGGAESMADKVRYESKHLLPEIDQAVLAPFTPILSKSLAKNPDDRYCSAQAFSIALQQAFEQTSQAAQDPAVSEATTRNRTLVQRATRGAETAPLNAGTQSNSRAPSKAPSSSSWEVETLRIVERQLASFVGPLAKIIVKRAAAQTADIDQLYALLATDLDSDEARRVFLAGSTRLRVARAAARGAETAPMIEGRQDDSGDPLSKGWQIETLRIVERQLASFVGPLAKIIVKRAAARTTDIDQLYALLATNVDSDEAQRAFLTGRMHLNITTSMQQTSLGIQAGTTDPLTRNAATATVITPAMVDHAARHLARFLGPIARVIANKAAQKSSCLQAFYFVLAEQLTSAEDRRQFLHNAGIV